MGQTHTPGRKPLRLDARGYRGGESLNSQGRVISVCSGKGGVGKTNIVVNLALALARLHKKVLILDGNLGLGNLDVLLGLAPQYNLQHLLYGEWNIMEVLVKGPEGILLLPAPSGVQDLTSITDEQKLRLLEQLDVLDIGVDIMLIDTGPGISDNATFFANAAQDVIVVASPEPTSIADAYAFIKVLHTKYGECYFKLLVNPVKNANEGKRVYKKLCEAADEYLNISIDYIGYILNDKYIGMAIMKQKPVVELYPDCDASRCFYSLAGSVCKWPANQYLKGNIQFLWRQVAGLTGARFDSAPEG